MKPIDERRMLRQLTVHEGTRLSPYYCTAGKLTIGVGRNLDDLGITEVEAQFLLKNDYQRVLKECKWSLGYWSQLTGTRKMVMVDMCFNLGLPRLMTFQKMLGALEARDGTLAAKEALDSKWAGQVGERAERIAALYRGE